MDQFPINNTFNVPHLLDEIIFLVVKTLPNWTKLCENILKLLLSWDEKLVLWTIPKKEHRVSTQHNQTR
jgi:hypothetical protein